MLKEYSRFVDDIRARGGEIVGVCAQSQAEADRAKEKWGIAFRLLGDPTCEVARLLNEKGWIESVIESVIESGDELEKLVGYRYEVGMLQPGVVALRGPTDDEKDDPGVLVTWGIVPTAENINGSVHRIDPAYAWRCIQKSLSGDFSDSRPSVVQKDKSMPLPFPIFYGMLLAKGNFVGFSPFIGDSAKSDAKKALLKLSFAVGLSVYGVARWPKAGTSLLSLYATFYFSAIHPRLQGRWIPKA